MMNSELCPRQDEPSEATALAVVRAARAGKIDHDRLIELLQEWAFQPRASALEARVEENSLDALDTAFFEFELLSEQEYDDLLDHALMQEPCDIKGPQEARKTPPVSHMQ